MSEPASSPRPTLYQQNYESNTNKTIGNISRTTYKSIISNQKFLVENNEKRS